MGKRFGLTFEGYSPRCKHGSVQQLAGVLWVVLIIFIQAEHERLDHQVGESVGSGGEHVGDAGVHGLVVSRVSGQLPGDEVWANNVVQVVSESDDLKPTRETISKSTPSLPSTVGSAHHVNINPSLT